jgi:endonuclease/exonuclease/phosphatase family metal-dependent hydrolase
MPATRIRVLTYNVHRCIGGDGTLAPARVARAILSCAPDVVALQELDIGHARTGHADQPAVLAEQLNMNYLFFPSVGGRHEHYGDAVMSRFPLTLIKAGRLPGLAERPDLEHRGALWVEIECGEQNLQVINTHLGLRPRERLAQVDALLGPDWLGHEACRSPHILCGDFNAWPGSRSYGRLRRALPDACAGHGHFLRRGTFPAAWPVVRLDHIFLSPDLTIESVRIPRTKLTRIASDHLPLVVEVSLP